MNPSPDLPDGLTRLIGTFAYDQQSLVSPGYLGVAIALFRVERAEPLAMRIEIPEGTTLVCAHVEGSIDWDCAINGRRYRKPCLPGTFNMSGGGEVADVLLRDADATVMHFYLPERLIAQSLADAGEASGRGGFELVDPMNSADPVLGRMASQAAARMRRWDATSRLEIEAAGLRLAAHLLRTHSNLSGTRKARDPGVGMGGLAPWQVARSKEAMVAVLDRGGTEPGLAELAALVGLSPGHFCRAFARSAGMPPHRWLIGRRIERACDLLRETNLSVGEIAARVGYEDPSYFARLFRQETGLSPLAYRRREGHGRGTGLT